MEKQYSYAIKGSKLLKEPSALGCIVLNSLDL